MSNIFLIHGAYGNPENNWFPWIQAELKKLGHQVYSPKFPTPEGQNLNEWLKVFSSFRQYVDKDTIMIGHSVGSAFILNILENLDHGVKASFFISGFIGSLNNQKFDSINHTFTEKKFDWQKIKQNCQNFTIFHSNNDPYVPLPKAEELAQNLGIEVNVIPNAGHFNTEAKWFEFPQLLEKLKIHLIER